MIESGLNKIKPDRRDLSVVHTYGALYDEKGLPKGFSMYDGRKIPDQRTFDWRFTPPVRPLPMGCTAETGSFETGIADKEIYRPDLLYDNTAPYRDGEGRDIRVLLKTIIEKDTLVAADGTIGPRRKAYFNCYGSGKIDDFDAARLGLAINQHEPRGIYIGTHWYPEFGSTKKDGIMPLPSFNTNESSLHCWLGTGWDSTYKADYLEGISWQGDEYGKKGLHYIERAHYNALMQQPWTGAFTITKLGGDTPVPIGVQALIDHVVYWLLNLFKV